MPVSCNNITEPEKFTKNVTENLALIRPFARDLVKNGPDSVFCCDEEQVADFFEQTALIKQILMKCPACYYNFIRIFLYMTCSPRQHEFIRVTDSDKETHAVNAFDFYIDKANIQGMYDSCINVKDPETGDAVFPSYLCIGLKAGEECTSDKLMEALGSKGNSQYNINFDYHMRPETLRAVPRISPMNEKVVSCMEKVPGFPVCQVGDCTKPAF